MESELRDRIIQHYIWESKEKGFQINQIRRELEDKGIPESEVRMIVKSVDYEIQKNIVAQTRQNGGNELILVGAITIMIGLGIMLFSFINSGELFFIFIRSGAVIWEFIFFIAGGFSLIKAGMIKKGKST